MADIQSNIHVNIDTSDALASLKLLQRQISAFHTQMSKSGASASAVAANQAQNLMNSINATGQFQASLRTVTSSTENFTNALEKNKLTSREYFRYTGAATKSFGRLFKSEFETINKVARERVKDIQTQYVKLGRGANGSLQAIAVRPLTLDMKNLGTQTAMAAQKQQLLNQLLKQGSTNLLNFGKNTQWAGRQLMVGFTVPLAMLGTTAAKTFMQMEEQAIRFKRVYGELFTTTEETDAMVKQIQSLAKEYTKYGVAVESTMKMAADAAAQGKMGADLMAQVAQATRLAVLGGVEQEEALQTTISVTNAFGVATEQLASKIDFLNAVENQTVVSIEDLTIAIPKAGPVVQQLGGDVEDLAFFLTAMKEGGINASEGANALKSGLASLINPSEKASKMLMGLGVNIKGIVEANQGDVTKTVVGFAQALDTLDPLNRARAIEQLFGKFQFSRLSTLFQNVTAQGTQASRVLGLASATTEELAILSERELDKISNTTTYKFKKSIEDLKVTIAPVGEQFLKALTPIVEFASKILEKFNNLGDGSKKFLTIMTVAIGGIGPILLMSFGLVANAIANIIKLFAGMKSAFNRAGSSTQVLGQQTSYLTQEQLEASAVAASLDQVHQRLKQTFTSEASAVNALAASYRNAIAAQAGFTGPGRVVKKAPGLKKYSVGTTGVPGVGNKDTIPAMLTPGEAVIPQQAAQDPNNRPIIRAMIAGKKVQGFNSGSDGVTESGQRQKTHVGGKSEQKLISDIIKNNPFMGDDQKSKLKALEAILVSQGMKPTTATLHKLMFTFPASMNMSMSSGPGINAQKFIDAWNKEGPGKWEASKINSAVAEPFDKAMIDIIKKDLADKKITHVNDDYVKKIFTERIPAERPDIAKGSGYMQAQKLYQTSTQFLLGKGLGNTPEESTRILNDAVKKGAIKSFNINTREGTGKTNKGKIVTGSATVTLNDGTVVNMNRLGSGHRVNISQDEKSQERSNAAAKRAASPSQAKQTKELKEISKAALKTKSGKLTPTDFGKQISPTSGYSFPIRGIGGVYEKPDGSRVFVKPVMDERAALAEQRATRIAREAHGLDAPEQHIRTMLDPTDPAGKRKIIALESAFNSKFDPANMSNTFTKDQYFRQLVAANLRVDKDLGRGNLSGNVLADVGPAGVFGSASGKRDFISKLPSMEEQARINLGIDEPVQGRKKFFAQATADIARSMTPEQYEKAMKSEIERVLPKLKKTISSFDLTAQEKPVYQAMIDRLEEGKKVDWKQLHKIHSSVLIKKDEMLEDKKTGKLSKPKTEKKPRGVKSSSKSPKDNKMTTVPDTKRVVQGPKRVGKTVMPGFANAPEAGSTIATSVVDGARGSIAEARAVGSNIGTTISQSAAAASRTALYGTGPIDAESKSVRRQLEKRQRLEAKTQAKAAASRTALYGTGPIDADAKSMRRNAEKELKRSKLAEKVAHQQSIISERAAEEAKRKSLSGRLKSFIGNRQDRRTARVEAGKRPGMGMGGALGIASGAAMIGSMAPGKVGEISQKVMMPLMGLAMILPMLKSPMSAVAIGLTATVGAFIALRMAFNSAQKKVLEESEKFKGSTSAVQELAKFSGKATASEQMDLRRQNMFTKLGPATGKTTYGEAFVQTKEGKALTQRLSEQNASGKGTQAVGDLTDQLSTAVMSGAMDIGQAKSLAMNAARQSGDMSLGVRVIAQIEELLGPNGERLDKEPLQVRLDMIAQNSKTMQSSIESINKADPRTKIAGQKTMQGVGIGASALGGAAAGAGIGGMIGGALGAVGGPLALITAGIGATIGAGIGAAVGGIGAYFASKKFTKQAGTLGAAAAVDAKIAMEQNKQMLDSFDMYYQKKIEELRLQGKINEANKMQTDYIKERDRLTDAQAALQGDVVSQYNNAGGLQESMMSGMKKATEARYKDDPNQLAYLDVVNTQAGDLRKSGAINSGQEFLIQAKMASGDIPPAVFRQLLGMAANNEKIAPQMMEIITKFSGATAESIGVAASGILGGDGKLDKEIQTKFITEVEAFEKDSDALDFTKNMLKLNNLNTVIPSAFSVAFYVDPKNKKAYEELNRMMDALETQKPKTVDAVYNIIPQLQGSAAFDEQYFNSLTDDQKQVYTTTIASIINIPDPQIIADEDYQAWLKETGPKGGAGVKGSVAFKVQKYKEAQGFKAVTDNVQVNSSAPVIGGGSSGGGSKVQSSPLDDLVKRLRDVRNNTIKVTEGFGASQKALNKLFSGTKDIQIFSGIENDMRKLGAGEDLIDLVTGMDPKEYERQKNKLFEFDSKGNISKLKDSAKSIGKAILSIKLGEFVSEQERMSKQIGNQTSALKRLQGAGVEGSVALEAVADATFAAAVANKKLSDKQLKKIVVAANQATAAQKRFAASSGLISEQSAMKERVDLLKRLTANASKFTNDQLEAIMDSPALQDALLVLKIDDPQFKKTIDDAIESANVELNIKKITVSGMQEIFDEGFSNAMEEIDVKQTALQLKFDVDTQGYNDIIDKAQDEISLAQFDIDDREAALKQIEEQEQKINEKYDERIEALDDVAKANESISQQQKGQLSLAEALTSGDIAAAAKAAQEIRSQQAAAAVTKQQEALEQSRGFELERVRTKDGKTRKQLEKEIKDLQDKIFNIEENRVEPAQEAIRKLEITLRDAIKPLDLQRRSWELIKNGVDLARVATEKFQKAIREALGIAESLKASYSSEKSSDPVTAASVATVAATSSNAVAIAAETVSAIVNATVEKTVELVVKQNNNSSTAAADAYALAKSKGDMNAASIAAAGVSPSKLASMESGSIGAASIASQLKSAETRLKASNPPALTSAQIIANRRAQFGYLSEGGLVPKFFAAGGFAKGTDTVPAMLTPGEFIVSKYGVDSFGVDNLKSINNGQYPAGSVYNNTYTLTVNAKTDANPDQIAQAVMSTIKKVDDRRVRGLNINGR